jgi:transposase
MSSLYWLSEAQMARLRPYFPKTHGVPRVDNRRLLSGIIFINRNGLRWSNAPDNQTISIGATYLKAHRTASSLRLKKGGVAGRSGGQKVV